ncbi:hypothetical protein AX769_17780 [Frondihabitans sp. PAMC 28766]|uniref:GNAT family N-acetyltransferase n=1 Tax=Frondihabitans sp. PAMC 28766 TaxID=1795630 RepID=UPI00078CC215|nr:GNAT family N-acetyltransferase [Frondihabitans sp. PAMC 28766]AMM21656.1 hypothetical protein AX769_17780 [Frondihabitans sp. PAMC 28766]
MNDVTPAVSLRPFAPDDTDDVLSWFADLDELRLFAGFAATWPLTRDDLEARALAPGVRSFTMTIADDPVAGHVDLVDEGGHVFRLARIAIAPSLRGRRLAVPLVEAAIVEARALGARSLSMHVVPGNEPAFRAYSRVGFRAGEPNPEQPGYVRMTLDL